MHVLPLIQRASNALLASNLFQKMKLQAGPFTSAIPITGERAKPALASFPQSASLLSADCRPALRNPVQP
eukprot:4603365-Pleurochrysis_carterae.AAC.3